MNNGNDRASSPLIRAAVERLSAHKFLFGAIVLTIILGFSGFSSVFPEFSILTRLYMTAQLFLLDPQTFDVSDTLSGVGAVPLSLELARWMAAIITCYGIVLGAWKLLKNSSGALKIQKLRGHIVVFGSGPVVNGLLDEFQEKKLDCVLLTSCHDLVEIWRERGGLAVEINSVAEQEPLSMKYLESTGLAYASAFYAYDDHDGNNLRAAMLVENFSTEARIIVRQDEPYACELLQRNGLLSPAKGAALRVISTAYARARILFHDFPLEWHPQKGLATEVHLVIPELGLFEKAVAMQAALIGHYPEGGRVNLWLGSDASRTRLLSDFPGISRCLNLRIIGEHGIHFIKDISQEAAEGALITIMATHLLPEDGYVQALRYRESWALKNNFRVVLSAPLAGGESLVSATDDLVVAPSLRDLAAPEALEKYDATAKKIHNTWYEGNQRRIDDALSDGKKEEADILRSKPTFKVWDHLTEHQKDVNRNAADHIKVKVRSVGCDTAQPDLVGDWEKLSAEQLDILSRMEHERWAAPLWMSGHKPGKRNDAARTHPDLVPYDELNQSTKDYDTEQVKQAAGYLQITPDKGGSEGLPS